MENCNSPLFSIVTVCYNSEKTIERTIKSVLAQQYTNYEYIIVDGGSTDRTLDIVKNYEPLFEGRMKWKSEPDKGIYDAFNKGIWRSKGTYVWIVNSDDFIAVDALDYLKNVINRYEKGTEPILSCALNYYDEKSGKITGKHFYNAKDAKRIYKMDAVGVVHPATLVPKRIYEEEGGFDDRYKLSGDCDWFHRVYKRGCPFAFIDHIVTNMSNAGISGQWNMKRYKISRNDKKLYFKKFYSNPIESYTRFLIWNLMFFRVMIKMKLK